MRESMPMTRVDEPAGEALRAVRQRSVRDVTA